MLCGSNARHPSNRLSHTVRSRFKAILIKSSNGFDRDNQLAMGRTQILESFEVWWEGSLLAIRRINAGCMEATLLDRSMCCLNKHRFFRSYIILFSGNLFDWGRCKFPNLVARLLRIVCFPGHEAMPFQQFLHFVSLVLHHCQSKLDPQDKL